MSGLIVAVTGLNRGDNPQPGYAVIRSLRRRFPALTVVGLVYDALESGVFADDGPDHVYTIPYPSSGWRALVERLDFILGHHPIDILIPTLDAEIEPLIHIEPVLAKRGLRMLLPALASYRARAKTILPQTCADCGLETPHSWLAWDEAGATEAAAQIEYPVMLKGQYYDARRTHHDGQLLAAFHEVIQDWGVPVLVQQCVHGGEFNVTGLGDGCGGVTELCSVRKTIVSSAGKGLGCVVVHEPRLDEIALRMIRHLHWRGPFELEFIHDEQADRFYVIEMNPRFPAWIDFPSALGMNFPAQVVTLLTGGRVESSPPLPVGRFFVRHQIELIGNVDQLAQLATDGVLSAVRSRA